MKLNYALLTALALTLPLASAMAQCVNPPSGIVGWWSGDGHFIDLAGTNSAMPTSVGFAAGEVGSAFLFGSGYLTIPVNPSYNCNRATGDYTLACWIRPDSTAWECLLNNRQWTFFLYQNTLGFARLTEGNPFHTIAGATPSGQWSHVALTRNGDTYCLWVNGQLANTTTRSDVPATTMDMSVGTDDWGALYDGRMDDLTIFNRGLSASELTAIYAAGTAGMCPPASPPGPVTFADDFSGGLNTNLWQVVGNTSTYGLVATNGELRISRPAGGTYSLQSLEVQFARAIEGDFDASVDFRDASINRVDGSPGNQIQFNTGFGGQILCVVRSDESGAGHNAHIWRNPPAGWTGTMATPATNGTLRIRRVGSTVTAYYNGIALHSGGYNTNTLGFLAFSLQNNGTRDATAVVFDNFQLTASHITPQAIGMQAHGANGVQFAARLKNPTPGAWHWIEHSSVLPAASWSTHGLVSGGAFPTNWSDPFPLQTPTGFYRVRSQ